MVEPPELADVIDWFLAAEPSLPREPFQLTPYLRVSDPAKAYAAWRIDIASTSSVRKQVLLQELQQLRECVERGGVSSARHSRADVKIMPPPSPRIVTASSRIVTPEQHRREQRQTREVERLGRGPRYSSQ
ncbi:MAG: hypothetical protein FJ147_15045 [Deltaproteobacteria bacterium]|nr:hypothetical protein [Deltaproteobacteria bacterium]